MSKSVAIVGAGPAGLVAAKIFKHQGFDITVYEKSDRIGGIWNLREDSNGPQDGFLAPQTPTNLSRFTVGFSDLDWREVDVSSTAAQSNGANGAGSGKDEGNLPMFPKAWQVNRYLEEYRKRYLPDESVFLFNCEVIKADRVFPHASDQNKATWMVTFRNTETGETELRAHEHLVIASGFFSQPRPLKQDIPFLGELGVQAIHSSRFRTLQDLFPDESKAKGKTILLVGGGNSAGEAAASVAAQLSHATYSPSRTKEQRKLYEGCKIVHVTPRPLYAIPPFVERDNGSRTYLPLDLKFYDFSRRPQMDSYGGQMTAPVRDIVHGAIQGLVGGDQSHLGADALVAKGKGEERGTPYVALSESYPQYVQSGMIEVLKGRVTHISSPRPGDPALANVEHEGVVTDLDSIGAVVYATGYTPSTALDLLSDDVKKALCYDPSSMRLPLILEQWQTMSREVPELAFLGFYEGPYWGVMEMQARLVAHQWSQESIEWAPQRPFEEREVLLKLREAMKQKAIDVPQYWFGDYLGYLEDISTHLGMKRNDTLFGKKEGCQSPARHLTPDTDADQARAVVTDLHRTWHDCLSSGRYTARVAFRALQGNWNIRRRIESKYVAYSGTFTGTAHFHPRFPTPDKSRKTFDFEYLYLESGLFTPSSNPTMSMQASRRYVYRYAEARDELSVWFVKPDKDLEVDYLFHDLAFIPPAEARKQGACVAKADHLCVEDMYWTEYRLPLEAIVMHEFEVKHTVKGPQKNYVAGATYKRPAKAGY